MSYRDPVRVVLLGDSHLARIRRDLHLVAPQVHNAAVGGACATDLLGQAHRADVGPGDVVAVSVGTNDSATWRQVSLAEFVEAVSACVGSVPANRWVYLAPPGVDEVRLASSSGRSHARLDRYRAAAMSVFADVSAAVVRTDRVIEPLGAEAFADDGLHLSGAGYGLVLPALAEAVRAPA